MLHTVCACICRVVPACDAQCYDCSYIYFYFYDYYNFYCYLIEMIMIMTVYVPLNVFNPSMCMSLVLLGLAQQEQQLFMEI